MTEEPRGWDPTNTETRPRLTTMNFSNRVFMSCWLQRRREGEESSLELVNITNCAEVYFSLRHFAFWMNMDRIRQDLVFENDTWIGLGRI